MTAHRTSLSRRIRKGVRAAFLLGLAASVACRAPTRPSATEGFGVVTGDWDGQAWHGLGYAVVENGSLQLFGRWQDPRYHYDEWVIVTTPFSGPGTYDIDVARGRLMKLVGGDAGSVKDVRGVLDIQEHDAASRTLRGTFTLASPDAQDRPSRFDNGRFEVVVYDRSSAVPRMPCRQFLGCVD
jgi:hypothetical protein